MKLCKPHRIGVLNGDGRTPPKGPRRHYSKHDRHHAERARDDENSDCSPAGREHQARSRDTITPKPSRSEQRRYVGLDQDEYPTVILPAQFAPDPSWSPEQDLVFAVLFDALNALTKVKTAQHLSRSDRFQTIYWILYDDPSYPWYTFSECCVYLQLDPDALRERVLKNVAPEVIQMVMKTNCKDPLGGIRMAGALRSVQTGKSPVSRVFTVFATHRPS